MADIRETIDRIQADVYERGDSDAVDELYTEDFVDHTAMDGLPPGREGVKQFVQMMDAAMSDRRTEIVGEPIISGDRAAWRWRLTGRHTGEWMGIPASGNEIELYGNEVCTFRDGKLAEEWSEADMLSLMTQIGALRAPAE